MTSDGAPRGPTTPSACEGGGAAMTHHDDSHSCFSCGAATKNEPLCLCDECDASTPDEATVERDRIIHIIKAVCADALEDARIDQPSPTGAITRLCDRLLARVRP